MSRARVPEGPSQPRSREPPQRTGKSGLWGSRGCTFGQRFLGLKVTTLDGDKPSFAQCVGRVGLSYFLVPLSYGITFFWALKGPGYRAVHDIATGTMIVRR